MSCLQWFLRPLFAKSFVESYEIIIAVIMSSLWSCVCLNPRYDFLMYVYSPFGILAYNSFALLANNIFVYFTRINGQNSFQ